MRRRKPYPFVGKSCEQFRKWENELNQRQQEKRKITCEMLLDLHKRTSFLHRIVTSDQKFIYFGNPKCSKLWVNPSTSITKWNRFEKKIMLCVWLDQKGVIYYELLEHGETVDTDLCQQQIINLNRVLRETLPEFAKTQHKVILLQIMSHHTQQNREDRGVELGDTRACGLHSRLDSVRMSSTCINRTRSR